MTHTSTLTYRLVRSLNDHEKNQFEKYLSVLGAPSHKNLMDACLKLEEFDDNLVWKHSKIKSKNHYRKSKTELKDLILEFLRAKTLKSPGALWRRQMDYAEALKSRGESFSLTAYKLLSQQIDKTQLSGFRHYTLLTARELMAYMNKNLGKNMDEMNNVSQVLKESLRIVYQNYFAYEFYEKVIAFAFEGISIKSSKREHQLKSLTESEFYFSNIDDGIEFGNKVLLNLAKTYLDLIQMNENGLSKNIFYFKTIFEQLNSKPSIVQESPETKVGCYCSLLPSYAHLKRWKEFEHELVGFKNFLIKHFPNKEEYPAMWGPYYNEYYSIRIYGPLRFDRHHLNELQNIIQDFNFNPLTGYVHCFNLLVLIGALKIDHHILAVQKAYTILDTEKHTTIRQDLVEVARYLLPIIQLAQLLADDDDKTSITWEYFKNTASQQYEYFRKKEKKYYQLEIRVTGFLKTLNKPVNQAEILEILDQLKTRVQEAEANDYLNQVKEIQRHFNLCEWIDKEKQRLQNQFRRSA